MKELIFNSFNFGEGVVVLKELIQRTDFVTVSTLGGVCGGELIQRTDF